MVVAAVGFQPSLGERALLLLNYQAMLGREFKGRTVPELQVGLNDYVGAVRTGNFLGISDRKICLNSCSPCTEP